MKIAHIVYSLDPNRFRGGISKVVYDLGRAQSQLGHDVTILTTDVNGNEKVGLDEFNENTFKIKRFSAQRFPEFGSKDMLMHMLGNNEAYAVIHGHCIFLPFNRYVKKVRDLYKIKTFYHAHGSLDPKVFNKGIIKRFKKTLYMRVFERKNLDSATGIFAITDDEKQQITNQNIIKPVFVLPNGVNRYNYLGSETLLSKYSQLREKQIITYIGRINEKKGLHHLVKAFSKITRKFSDAHLVIGGDYNQFPSYFKRLKEIIDLENIDNKVIWLGFLDEKLKSELLGITNIFSHVSESEGMAISILEAMSAKLPVLVSKGCYMNEAVRNNAVIEVEYSEMGVFNGLEKLLANPPVRLEIATEAQNYVNQYHSWQNIAKQSIEIYENA